MSHVFISYSRQDAREVDQLADAIEAAGITTWVDREGIDGGEEWDKEVAGAIAGCDAFLLALSPASVASEPVKAELNFAIEEKRKIIPVVLKPVEIPPAMRFRLGTRNRIDATSATGVADIIKALGGLTNTPPPPLSHAVSSPRKKLIAGLGVLSIVLLFIWLMNGWQKVGEDDTDSPSINPESEQAEEAQPDSSRFEEREAFRPIQVRTLLSRGHEIRGTDPRAVAFNIYGDTDYIEEGGQPVTVEITHDHEDYKVILVTDNHGGDDSVGGTRYRIEFEPIDDTRWQIKWVGDQWRCLRGSNPGWGKVRCP